MNTKNKNNIDESILRMRELLECPSMADMEKGKSYEVHIPKSDELGDVYRLTPMADSVFKIIFQNEEYKMYTCKLISAIIGIDYDYLLENMTFYKNTFNKSSLEEAQRNGDLVIKLGNKYIMVEMNNYESLGRNFKNSILLSGIRIPNKNGVKFYPAIEININNYRYKEMNYSIDVTSDISILPERQWFTTIRLFHINIFIPIIEEKSYNELNETEKVILALFSPFKKKIEPLIREDKLLMEYNDTLDDLERNLDFLYDYDFELEKETVLKEEGKKEGREEGKKEGREEGKKEGREEGKKEGREEGRLEKQEEIIKRMVEKGLELSIIADYINLDIEEVKKIIQSFK